ncbi:MAG: hypothetical protein A3I32_01775 [Candidatus Yanofskybacteria bacterium RIFCSPLOWO2_02_FULL_45_10]|uniref:Transposase IS200-like domain-containing protein n=2 Tax=Candidatus Yanofskyibacteriota TaxID=1752733 RepID=A0A1F8G1Y3_9BACT|nr:MAG: hypothetical protein A3F25_01465 [Candidatus Yanofskybacteria bacterium RIFCSPHIGHO2_12_FULL_45_19b]OGN32106.1 MAG: hypothetical protein A3I32_01775 [Candidatus Yanofskybacteria bacterium RIFCSPLOWO2_02_FULL_45_10]
MSRSIVFSQDEFYHLYNRGTEKRIIFSAKADYERFIALLYLCNDTQNVHLNDRPSSNLAERLLLERVSPLLNIGAYCLMPNHFHLIVQERGDNGISRFMQKIITGYTMYFNKRYERTGALFQGEFKATHANQDEYLKYLISYIHLNPIKIIDSQWKEEGIKDKKRAENFLDQYLYSSYLDYCGKTRPERKVINKDVLPRYFSSVNNFKTTTRDWLTSTPKVEPRG